MRPMRYVLAAGLLLGLGIVGADQFDLDSSLGEGADKLITTEAGLFVAGAFAGTYVATKVVAALAWAFYGYALRNHRDYTLSGE